MSTTSTAPDADHVGITPSTSAESFDVLELAGHPNLADYVSEGLQLSNIDWSTGEFDLSEGKAFWLVDEIDDRESQEYSRHQCLFTAYYSPRTNIAFNPSQTQYVYAQCNGVFLGDPTDAPKIVVQDTQDPPREDSFLFATLDPSSNSVYYDNQNPDGIFGSLEADEVVIRDSLEADGLVDTAALADKSVTEPKLDDDAVSQRAAGPNSIGSPELIDGSIAEGDLGDDSVSTRALIDRAVTEQILGLEAVRTEHILDGALTTEKYANKSVTGSKVADTTLSARTLKARSVQPDKLDRNKRYSVAGLTSSSINVNTARSNIRGQVGAATGEVNRIGGPTADLVEMVQNGEGHYFLAFNAEFRNGEWRYRNEGVPAMTMGMHGGRILHWTAGPGSGVINWDKAYTEDGAFSDSKALGGVPASEYFRHRGVVDITKDELTLLNDWNSGRGRNTSHDLVWENQPSGDRIHQQYARPEMRMFVEPHFSNPMWTARKNGEFEPGMGLVLGGGQDSVPAPAGGSAITLFYNEAEFRVRRDNGQRGVIPVDWSG